MVQVVYSYPIADESQPLRIEVSFNYEITIPPKVARRRANAFLAGYVAMMVTAGEPMLILKEDPVWKVPACLRLPEQGEVGSVGVVHVDARTGEVIMPTKAEIHHMQELAHAIAAHYTSATATAG